MGLDVAFSRKAALDCGLAVFKSCVGSAEAIAQAVAEHDDQGYIDYLSQEREYIQVPNVAHVTENTGLDDDIVVRANHWGSTYAPLTAWLKDHNITWSEF